VIDIARELESIKSCYMDAKDKIKSHSDAQVCFFFKSIYIQK